MVRLYIIVHFFEIVNNKLYFKKCLQLLVFFRFINCYENFQKIYSNSIDKFLCFSNYIFALSVNVNILEGEPATMRSVTWLQNPALGKVCRLMCVRSDGTTDYADVAVEKGFNLFSWHAKGWNILYCSLAELSHTGFGGMPILYPAPNRTRNGRYRWGGEDYAFRKKGEARTIHGLVYDEPWRIMDVRENECAVTGRIDFTPGSELFDVFPFEHTLEVTYQLDENALSMRFVVENTGARSFPFGLGIHTYFWKENGAATICVPTEERFESDDEHFPHAVVPVSGTYDLRQPVQVDALNLDDVYTNLGGKTAQLRFPSAGKRLLITGTEAFANAVVFTPKQEPYFCYENQTCMTNAFNAETVGLADRSGLLVVQPGERKAGAVRFLAQDAALSSKKQKALSAARPL